MKNKILTIVLGVFIGVFILTVSIGLPIYFRPFYYMQIKPLDIPSYSGEDYDTIKEAYDDLLDYLTLPGREFKTGIFRYSAEGKSHFEDCKRLFNLNGAALIISLAGIITLFVLAKKKVFTPIKPFGYDILFSSGSFTLGFFALVGLIVAIDFDKAFDVFHIILFPGKKNWYFNWHRDQIIRVLPEEFFISCAILILSSIILLCAACIVIPVIKKRKIGSQQAVSKNEL